MPEKNNIELKTLRKKPLMNIANKHVLTLISVGKGISEEKVAPEEELYVEFLKQLNQYSPKKNIILVAGLLKRWNFWEMIEQVKDDELARRLEDIPKNINEEKLVPLLADKFVDVAASIEKDYIQSLEDHLQKNKDALKGVPYQFISWDQREKFDNFTKKSCHEKKLDDDPESDKFIKATIDRFLKKKNLDIAKERLVKAMPEIANLDFDKLVHDSCLAYILEEYEYFTKLSNTEVFYNGSIPALNPILKDDNNNLHWHSYQLKQRRNLQEETKIPTTTPFSHHIENDEIKSGLKRLSLFSYVDDQKSNGHTTPEAKEQHAPFTPRTIKRMKSFFDAYSKMPPATKALADQKIDEIMQLHLG